MIHVVCSFTLHCSFHIKIVLFTEVSTIYIVVQSKGNLSIVMASLTFLGLHSVLEVVLLLFTQTILYA